MAPPTQPKRSILVVEDSAEIRDVWRRVLTGAGFLVVEAADGADGVRKAQQDRPDVILMDLNLPVVDGITAIKQLKADSSTMDVPIVVVSGDICASSRAYAAGCEVFRTKPIRAVDLLSAIEYVLAGEQENPAASGLTEVAQGK
jgi:CheY-like chemotaxis protein